MTSKLIDITGQRFGRLTVVGFSHFKRSHGGHKTAYWKCVCDCGNEKITTTSSLRSETTRSCGCLRKELNHKRLYKGLDRRLYGVHRMMVERCYKSDSEHYKNYGGRGITVCPEWLGKNGCDNFRRWADSHGYKRGLTLDRIDNDKGYSPDNCQWATRKHQSNNKRNNIWIEINGKKQTLAQWCEEYNVPYGRTEARYVKMGWSIMDALLTPRYGKPIGGT